MRKGQAFPVLFAWSAMRIQLFKLYNQDKDAIANIRDYVTIFISKVSRLRIHIYIIRALRHRHRCLKFRSCWLVDLIVLYIFVFLQFLSIQKCFCQNKTKLINTIFLWNTSVCKQWIYNCCQVYVFEDFSFFFFCFVSFSPFIVSALTQNWVKLIF